MKAALQRELRADDRLDARFFRCPEKLRSRIEPVVVSKCEAAHARVIGGLDELLHGGRPVEQREIGMAM